MGSVHFSGNRACFFYPFVACGFASCVFPECRAGSKFPQQQVVAVGWMDGWRREYLHSLSYYPPPRRSFSIPSFPLEIPLFFFFLFQSFFVLSAKVPLCPRPLSPHERRVDGATDVKIDET